METHHVLRKLSCAQLIIANIISSWEKLINLNEITMAYQFKRNRLSQLDERTRSHDFEASCAIRDSFLAYGWSSSELFGSETKVVEILIPSL